MYNPRYLNISIRIYIYKNVHFIRSFFSIESNLNLFKSKEILTKNDPSSIFETQKGANIKIHVVKMVKMSVRSPKAKLDRYPFIIERVDHRLRRYVIAGFSITEEPLAHCFAEPVHPFNGYFSMLVGSHREAGLLWELVSRCTMCTTTDSCGKYLHPSCARQIAIKRGFMVCKLVYTVGVSAPLSSAKKEATDNGEFPFGDEPTRVGNITVGRN